MLQAEHYTSSYELASPEAVSPTSYKSLATPVSEANPLGVCQQVRDRCWDRLHPLFHLGEVVLVCAGPVPKGKSPYHGPLEVVHVLGWFMFELSDGQRWGAR